MIIQVDVQEPGWLRGKVQELCETYGWVYEEGAFVADVIIGDIYIERKQAQDLVSSITSSHLPDQLKALSELAESDGIIPVLLIEEFASLPNCRGIPYYNIRNWIAGLMLKWPRIHVVPGLTVQDTVDIS